jgi:hypothetical protein
MMASRGTYKTQNITQSKTVLKYMRVSHHLYLPEEARAAATYLMHSSHEVEHVHTAASRSGA